MASSSNSSVPKSFKYDVFLSFRGDDTRNNFVGHLYEALQRNCIETYKDDEKIEKGERINDQLLKSIEDSRFYIIVFSKNYASSSWCLDELVKIMECQKLTEHTAFPVFYDVEPTQVRKQDGPVGEAFSKPSKQEAAGKWRDAMEELAGLAGWDLKATANGDESKLIKLLVDIIFNKKFSTLSNADGKLVGMETRISDVLSSLEIDTEDVRMIGIKGMGGGGKTTLARAVYDQISHHFDGKSFVDNVREVSEPTLSGVKKLQKQILKDVLNKQDITFGSVHDGKSMLKAAMCCRKILVVLDDVDHIEQLEALAGEHDWFKSGSRIIVTTRDEQVLKSANFVHDVNLLSHEEAICLFSINAFPKETPLQEYEELSEQVVKYANGLPLTIEVLGKLLCGKDKGIWVDVIRRLKEIPLKATLDKLELSYNSLEDEHKQIFLDIVCILKGDTKENAIRILECCGYYAIHGLKVLEQRSLITISEDEEYLGMHDHIEEMGKNIVRRFHPDEPNKHSRLWIREEIEDILDNDMGTEATICLRLDISANDMGTEATKCLRLDMWRGNLRCLRLGMLRGNSGILLKGLGKMKKLVYLQVIWDDDQEPDEITQHYLKCEASQYFTNSLKYLKYERYPFLYLPKAFQANNLVGLEMRRSTRMVQLWKKGEKKVLKKLKFLSISESKLTTFDFRITPNLETLSLETSFYLKELHMPASCQKLKFLYITFSKLITFDLGLTPNLETLSLFSCTHFVKLKVSVPCPNLKFLELHESWLTSLDLELIPNLEKLHLNNCFHFVELHVPTPCTNLKYLNLCYSRLMSLDLELIPNLENLDLRNCKELVQINAPVGCLKKVVELNLHGCVLLEKLPEDLSRLGCLKELDITCTGISHLPQSIFGLKGLRITAPRELLQLYVFPSEIKAATSRSRYH